MNKRRFSDTWVALGLLVVLFTVVIAGAFMKPQDTTLPALSSRSSTKNGARALYTWLSKQGYDVSNKSSPYFDIPEETTAVFLLAPSLEYVPSEEDWAKIDSFVEDGGILVAAGENTGSQLVAEHYDMSLSQSGYCHTIVAFTPVLKSPQPDFDHTNITCYYHLTGSGDNIFPILVENNQPYAVEITKGEGKVILAADSLLFANAILKEPGAPELLLNLLAPIPRGSHIWFDEWHHGDRVVKTEPAGLQDWLIYSPFGQAVLWIAIVVFAGLVMTGLKFGRPVPMKKDVIRRAPLEFVNALARLNQRANHRKDILEGYHRQLRRALCQRYRIDPDLTDQEIVNVLKDYLPENKAAELSALFKKLAIKKPSEPELVELANKSSNWIQEIERSFSGSLEQKNG